jgi:hypothetical protein
MKTLNTLAFGMLCSVILASNAGAAPQFGGGRARGQERVCFYQDVQYQGMEQCYNAGDEVSNLQRRNNFFSSIRIYGRARVTVYDNTEFRGHSAEFTTSVPDLNLRSVSGSRNWSDHIQSFRINPEYGASNGRNYPTRDYPTPDLPVYNGSNVSDGICVYDRPNFQGREQCWSSGADISDLGRSGNWSDRISSIRVLGRSAAVLYRDIGFRGESIMISQDEPDLGRLGASGFRNWDHQVSSLIVESNRGGNFPGRGRARGRYGSWR